MFENNFDEFEDEFSQNQSSATSTSAQKKTNKNNESSRRKRKESLRIRLFKIYYVLTRERNTDSFQAMFLILVMFIQIYDLIISPIMKIPFKGALYKETYNFMDVFRIYPAVIQQGNVDAYWFFMDKTIVIVVLYILKLILLDFTLSRRKYQMHWPIKILQFKSAFIFWIYLIPATDFLISIFECTEEGLHKYDQSLVCWQTKHAFLCALYSLTLVLFICITVVISLFYNESRPYYTDALTRTDINQEVFLTFYRVIVTVVSHYTAEENFHWLVLALHFLMSCHLIKNYQKYLPYYFSTTSTVYGACCIGYLWVTINAILAKALESIDFKGQMIVVLIGFVFLYPCAYYLRKNRIYEILMLKNQEKIKSDLELEQFVTNFQQLLIQQETNEDVEMMFLGFLYMHREECTSSTCPLKTNESLYLPLNDQSSKRDMFPSKDKILHQHLVNSIFAEYQKQHPNQQTAVMHTSYSNFLFYQMGNTHMALIELNLGQKCSQTLQQGFTIFKAKHIIEEYLVKRFRQGTKSGNNMITSQNKHQAYAELDVTIVITFEGLFNRLEKQIEQSASDHIEFWSHLDSNMIDLNVINKLGLNIINQTKKVNEIWKKLTKINPNYPNALYLYGNYLSQVKNDNEQGEDYRNLYHQVKRLKNLDDYENQFDLMFAEDTTVIIMNGSKEQQGKIIKTNQGIFKLFGYSMFEVQGHDVNILMPPVIAVKHQIFLEKYFRTGKERIINNCLESFAMYRTGIIFPIHLVVKQVPSLRNDIQYIGMIKRSNRDYEYILTDENGKIDSISEGITSLLKLPISFFKDHDIPIQVLVPELCEVARNRVGGEQITNFEAWNGIRDLRFIVPKNLSNSASRAGANQTMRHPDSSTTEDLHSGSGTGTGNSSTSKNFKHLHNLLGPNSQPTFIGLKSADSLKIISNMFKGAEHKACPEKYKTNLLNNVNYINPDFDKTIKTEIMLQTFSEGELKVKVLKIFYSKKKKNQGQGVNARRMSEESSNNGANGQNKDEETLLHQFGMTGMQALNDKIIFQKYKELINDAKNMDKSFNPKRLQHDIDVLRILLDRQRKVRTYGNIQTPEEYENLELERMKRHIELLEQQIQDMTSEGKIKGSQQMNQSVNEIVSLGMKTGQFLPSYQNQNSQNSPAKGLNDDETSQIQGSFPKEVTLDQKSLISPHFIPQNRETNNPYDQDLDEEDSKTQDKKTRPQNDNDGNTNNEGLDKTTTLGKSKRVKEDPRRDFVNDFLKQNLKQGVLNSTTKKDASNIRNEQQRSSYMPDLQNDNLLRNLQDNTKLKREKSNKQNESQFSPDKNTRKKDGKNQANDSPKKVDSQEERKSQSGSVKMLVEDTGSVASDTKTLMRHLRVLRNALYENYSPQSIQNLKYSARFVLVVLLSMTIASFIFSKEKYDQLKENFYSIQASQERMQSITSIHSSTRISGLINEGTVNRYRYGPNKDYFEKMKYDLNHKATILHQSQNNLSQTQFDFTDENKHNINPHEILLYYNSPPEVGNTQILNIWSTVMQLAINSYQLKDMDLKEFKLPKIVTSKSEYEFEIDRNINMSVWFILRNSMNNVLQKVIGSTQSILEDTKILAQQNKQILMILLVVASGCLLASMLIIMPVVTKVHQDKDKLLSLFLLIDSNDVKEQLKHCKDFFTLFHTDDKSGAGGPNAVDANFEFDEEGKEGEGDKSSEKDTKKEEKKEENRNNRFTRKNKKLKKYSTNYLMLLLKFLVFISLLESYFLYQYFQSDKFLNRSLDMIKEAASITNRNFHNFLLYQVVIEIIATNGTAHVFNQKSTDYIVGYLDQFNQELEDFLKIHGENVNKHDEEFNSFFDELIYQSVCKSIDSYFTDEERQQCSSYLGGVLEKGLYSANLAFWDDMREIRDSYFKSDKSQNFLKNLINSERLIQNEKLNEIYFFKAYNILMQKQNESITVQFDNRNKEVLILFAFYLLILIFMFFILWGRFVESMRHSLWVTKSMLAIIPLEVIEKVKLIKDFLLATGRSAMNSLKE